MPDCNPVTTVKLNDALKYHTNVVRSKKWGKVGITRAKPGEGKKRKRSTADDATEGRKKVTGGTQDDNIDETTQGGKKATQDDDDIDLGAESSDE